MTPTLVFILTSLALSFGCANSLEVSDEPTELGEDVAALSEAESPRLSGQGAVQPQAFGGIFLPQDYCCVTYFDDGEVLCADFRYHFLFADYSCRSEADRAGAESHETVQDTCDDVGVCPQYIPPPPPPPPYTCPAGQRCCELVGNVCERCVPRTWDCQ
jgi:hypothetical protein